MLAISVLVGFILLQLAIGIFVSKFINTADDFYIAGRKQGSLIITFSLFATWFGSESCLSSAGRVSAEGLMGARGDPLAYVFCLLIYGFILARRLWSQKVVSIGNVIGNRFGKGAELITGFVLVFTSLLWAAGQVRAFGHVLSMHLHLNFTFAVILAASIAVIYTAFGGLLADMYTDLVQGIMLIIGLVMLIFIICTQISDFYPLEILRNLPLDRISMIENTSFSANIEVWLVPIAGSIISQELVARISGSASKEVAAKSAVMAGVLFFSIGMIPVVLGLLAPHLIGIAANGDETLLLLAQKFLPFWISLLFSAALVSAILSTVDSALLAASTAMTRNVVNKFIDLTNKNKLEILLARSLVAVGGAVACIFALTSESIYDLVVTASSFGTAGIFILFMVALFSKFGSAQSGFPTVIVGLLGTIIFEYVLELDAPFYYSLICSAVCFVSLELLLFAKNKGFRPVPLSD
ncbi:MAG: sodium:solute symporter [bacterium]|nr:sodium:solute symporter [bacterium]